MSVKPVVTLSELRLESSSQGTRFGAATAEFGASLGLYGVGAALYVVPPGRSPRTTPSKRALHTDAEGNVIGEVG